MENKSLDPKKYNLAKYLLTFSNLFLLIPIILLNLTINGKQNLSKKTYIIVSILLLLISLIFYLLFFYIRWCLHKKSNYKNQKRDNIFLIIFIFSVFLLYLIPIILISLVNNLTNEKIKTAWWISSIIVQFIIMFISSVLETMSRFQEYNEVYKKRELNAQHIDFINLAKKRQKQYEIKKNDNLDVDFQNLINDNQQENDENMVNKEND